MHRRSYDPRENEALLAARVAELRQALRAEMPAVLAARCGAEYLPETADEGNLRLPLWQRPVRIAYPKYIAQDESAGKPVGVLVDAMLLYHLTTTDGTPLAGSWISFSELPDGRFYNAAYTGYTGHRLARAFGNDQARFREAALNNGGLDTDFGDCAFAFRMLPRVALLAVAWSGDEDFAPSYQILFDAAVSHHLPTDACAIAGSMLTHRLLAGNR